MASIICLALSKGFIELQGEAVNHEMTEVDPGKHAVDLSKIPYFDEGTGLSSTIPKSLGDMGGDEGGRGLHSSTSQLNPSRFVADTP